MAKVVVFSSSFEKLRYKNFINLKVKAEARKGKAMLKPVVKPEALRNRKNTSKIPPPPDIVWMRIKRAETKL